MEVSRVAGTYWSKTTMKIKIWSLLSIRDVALRLSGPDTVEVSSTFAMVTYLLSYKKRWYGCRIALDLISSFSKNRNDRYHFVQPHRKKRTESSIPQDGELSFARKESQAGDSSLLGDENGYVWLSGNKRSKNVLQWWITSRQSDHLKRVFVAKSNFERSVLYQSTSLLS